MSSSQTPSSSLNNSNFANVVGPGFKIKWDNHLNGLWCFESCDQIIIPEEAESLFEHLLSSKEVIPCLSKPTISQELQLPDYEFERITLNEQKSYIISQLMAQFELASAVCLESKFFTDLRKRLLILSRIFYAISTNYHDKDIGIEKHPNVTNTPSSTKSIIVKSRSDPSQTLIEMGVRTGLTLIFNILKLNWNENTTQSTLCKDVLVTASDILWTLPPLSLANADQIPKLGHKSLDDVTGFLKQIVSPTSGANLEYKVLAAEIHLALCLQRGGLQYILDWIDMALFADQNKSELYITLSAFENAITIIRQCFVKDVTLYDEIKIDGNDQISIYSAFFSLMEELVALSLKLESFHSKPCNLVDSKRHSPATTKTKLNEQNTSKSTEVYVFGSNSSAQLSDSGPERIFFPKLSSSFGDDLKQIEAGQYCSFSLNQNGTMSACGKGSYGRLGLGDSNNQIIPKKLQFPDDVQISKISSSKGGDGHTLVLTTDGKVFSFGDGDFGKLGHGGIQTEKCPKLIHSLVGKIISEISAGFRHSASVSDEGNLYMWGEGTDGRLGLDLNDRQIPTLVRDICNVGWVSCGSSHSLVLSRCRRIVWSFGNGDDGKLGHGIIKREIKPKVIEALQGLVMTKIFATQHASFFITDDGKLFRCGSGILLGKTSNETKILIPEIIPELSQEKVIDISIGESHVLVLTSLNEVWAFGNNSLGQCGIGISLSPVLSPQKVAGLDKVKIQNISAGSSHSILTTFSHSNSIIVPCTAISGLPFWISNKPDTIVLLKNFLQRYGLDFSKVLPPFDSESKHYNFVILCLKLLNSHCAILIRKGHINSDFDEILKELRLVLFEMLNSTCIQQAVVETLTKNSFILLPPLKDKIDLLLKIMLKGENSSKGENLLRDVFLKSLEDNEQISKMIGKSNDCFKMDEVRSTTEHLMTNILTILFDDIEKDLDQLCNLSNDSSSRFPTEFSYKQRLYDLLTSLQNHIFTCCMYDKRLGLSNEIIWSILINHLKVIFEKSQDLFNRISTILTKAPGLVLKISKILYLSISGTMIYKLVHSMLIPNGNFTDIIDPLIKFLISMENLIRNNILKLDSKESRDAWEWFMEMEKCISHLVGRIIGEMIRGSPPTKEEINSKYWLTSRLFSNGLNGSIEDLEIKIKKSLDIFITDNPDNDDWCRSFQNVILNFNEETKHFFNIVLPLTPIEDSTSSINSIYELMFEHGKSLDWETSDIENDFLLHSISKVLLLVLLKHTGLENQVIIMTLSELRKLRTLNEVFALVFQMRIKLYSKLQDELIQNSISDENIADILMDIESTEAQVGNNQDTEIVNPWDELTDEELSTGETSIVFNRLIQNHEENNLTSSTYASRLMNFPNEMEEQNFNLSSSAQINPNRISNIGPSNFGRWGRGRGTRRLIRPDFIEIPVYHENENISLIHQQAADPNILMFTNSNNNNQVERNIFESLSQNITSTRSQLLNQQIKSEPSVTKLDLDEKNYKNLCKSIIERSLLLMYGIKGTTNVSFSNSFQEYEYDDEQLPKPSETIEDRYDSSKRGSLTLVRKLGRNILRYVAPEILNSRNEFEQEETGWSSDSKDIKKALDKQKVRAEMRFTALEKISTLVSQGSDSQDGGCLFLSSVSFYILAGVFNLGIQNIQNPLEETVTTTTATGVIDCTCNEANQFQLQLTHYLDGIESANIHLKNQITKMIHMIFKYIFINMRTEKNDQVKMLNISSISCIFQKNDLTFFVKSGLLDILQNLCVMKTGTLKSIGEEAPTISSSNFGKIINEVSSCSHPYMESITLSSVRLLHMIAVSASINANRIESDIIEKITDVLNIELKSMINILNQSQENIQEPSTSQAANHVEFASINQQFLNSYDLQEIENLISDNLIFIRHLISQNTMGKFLCNSKWIKLILNFISFKPVPDVEAFLNLEKISAENAIELMKKKRAFTKADINMCKNLLFTPGLRPRLLGIQLLETILTHFSSSDSNNFKTEIVNNLIDHLYDSLFNLPYLDRAKRNILNRDEICLHIFGQNLSTQIENIQLAFDPEKTSCTIIENNQTLVHGKGGRGYGVSKTSFKSGVHQWKFLIVKENRGNEGTLIGVCKSVIRDQSHRTTADMWLYRAYSGNLYHKGELQTTLHSFTQGDYITCILDISNKTLSFGKNGQEPVVAFQNVEGTELFPCVLFYSTNPGEKVKIVDYEPKRNFKTLTTGEPYCSPYGYTLAESYIQLIRRLYLLDNWTKIINECLMIRLKNGKDIHDEYKEGEDEGELKNENKKRPSSYIEINKLCKVVSPVLAIIGGVDRGLRIGSKCLHTPSNKNCFILGTKPGLNTIQIQFEETISDVDVDTLEPLAIDPFEVSKFTCLNAEIMRFLTKLSGITNEFNFPNEDPHDKPFEILKVINDDNDSSAAEITELTTSLKVQIPDEASEKYLWDAKKINDGQTGHKNVPPAKNSNQIVEALSDQMVSNIMNEVTRDSAFDFIGGSAENPELSQSFANKEFLNLLNLKDRRKIELKHEDAFIKITKIEFGAMKVIQTILSCNYFSEFILVPKKKKCPPRHPPPTAKKDEEEEEEKKTEENEESCPNCGKVITNQSSCSYCSDPDNMSLKFAILETYKHIVKTSIKACKFEKLVPLSELERTQAIIHFLHVKEVVDYTGPSFSCLNKNLLGDNLHDNPCSTNQAMENVIPPNNSLVRKRPQQASAADTPPASLRASITTSTQRSSLPMTLASIASRHYPTRTSYPSDNNDEDRRGSSSGSRSYQDDWLLRRSRRPENDNDDSNGTIPICTRSIRTSHLLRRRQRSNRSPSPPNVPSIEPAPQIRRNLTSRIPSSLIEMGFSPAHIRSALQALGLSGELSIQSQSQLATWMIENPSIGPDDGRSELSQRDSALNNERRMLYAANIESISADHRRNFAFHDSNDDRRNSMGGRGRGRSRINRSFPNQEENSSTDAIMRIVRAQEENLPTLLLKIPIVVIHYQYEERGICPFCRSQELDINNHFIIKHPGCNNSTQGCGETKGTYYLLCTKCYDQNGGKSTERINIVTSNLDNESSMSLSLPPLPMPNAPQSDPNEELSVTDFILRASLKGSNDSYPLDSYELLLPYLGLREDKKYPEHLNITEPDPLGESTVEKVVNIQSLLKRNSESLPNFGLGEQAMTLVDSRKKILALKNSTEAAQVMISRDIVVQALKLLNISDAYDIGSALEKIGLDIKCLIKLMNLTAAGRLNSESDLKDDENNRIYPNEKISNVFNNLPYNGRITRKLHHIAKAVEELISSDTDSAVQIIEMCCKELRNASYGYVKTSISEDIKENNFLVCMSINNILSQSIHLQKDKNVTSTPSSPSSCETANLNPSLNLIDSLSSCVMSGRLSSLHRQWAIEQLVKCLCNRASVPRFIKPSSLNISDLFGILNLNSSSMEVSGHENRVKTVEYSKERKNFASSGYDGTVRVWEASYNQSHNSVRQENTFMFQKMTNLYGKDLNGELISNLCWSKNGKYLAATMNYFLNIWMIDQAECYVQEETAIILKVIWPKNTSEAEYDQFLVVLADGTLLLYTISPNFTFTKEILLTSQDNQNSTFVDVDWPHQDKRFAIGYSNGTIKFIKRNSNSKPYEIIRSHENLTSLKYNTCGSILATVGLESAFSCRLWNRSYRNILEIYLEEEPSLLIWSTKLHLNSTCDILAIGLQNGQCSIWKLNKKILQQEEEEESEDVDDSLKQLHPLKSNIPSPISCLCINESGSLVATAYSKGNLVNLWSLDTGLLVYTYISSNGSVMCLNFIGDSNLAACFSRSKEITIIQYSNRNLTESISLACCRTTLLYQGLNTQLKLMPAFKGLLTYLPQMINDAYQYEKKSNVSLMFSRYLQGLAGLALNMKLDKALLDLFHGFETSKNCENHWDWLQKLGLTIRTAESLLNRTKIPPEFIEKYHINTSEALSFVDETGSNSFEIDYELMKWANQSPDDWLYGGKGEVYMFGCGRLNQLGNQNGRNETIPKLISLFQGSHDVICGQNCTFLICNNGVVKSLGEGNYGRLGHGNSDDCPIPQIITGLQGYVIISLATSLGSDGHSLALSEAGGHGNSDRQRRPKQIDALKNLNIIQVAVGYKHSAALTDSGQVWMWGSCESGRLGNGESTGNKKIPEPCPHFSNTRIGLISCGAATTICCSSNGNRIWAFGEGENGKLGLGNIANASTPQIIEDLENKAIEKICCSKNFSLFLSSKSRTVWFAGKLPGNPIALRPIQIPGLQDIVDMSCGQDFALFICSNGDLYGLGNNSEFQIGLGHNQTVREPELVLKNCHIQQVSCGRNHSAAFTSPRKHRGMTGIDLNLGTPVSVPEQYQRLQNIPIPLLKSRLQVLNGFSDLIYNSWRFLPLSNPVNNFKMDQGPISPKLRGLLSPRVHLPFIRTVSKTMVQTRTYGPQIVVRRLGSKGLKKKPIFTQISSQILQLNPADLRLPARAWKVKLIGEGADDAGGAFDDTISEICVELTKKGGLPYLIPVPNFINETGYNRDQFLLNPDLTTHEDLLAFKFIGILMGVSIRTKKPIAIPLAPFIWKILVGEEVSSIDLEQIDCCYVKGLQSIKDPEVSGFNEENFHEIFPIECYEGTTSTGKLLPIVSGGRSIPLTFYNRLDYIEKAINFRLHEMDLQIQAVREGLSGIIPVPLLSLMKGSYLEELVCGSPTISLEELKQIVRYREMDETHELVKWLWSILEGFTNAEPDITQRFQIMKVDRPLNGLPTAQTCFFQLRLPPYSSKETMEERLLYAINNCIIKFIAKVPNKMKIFYIKIDANSSIKIEMENQVATTKSRLIIPAEQNIEENCNNEANVIANLKKENQSLKEKVIAQSKDVKNLQNQLRNSQNKFKFEKCKWKKLESQLRNELKTLKPKKEQLESYFSEKVSHIFTPIQQKIILKKLSRTHYSTKEISQAILLRQYAGKKGYNFVKNVMKFPLPGISTIKNWLSKIEFQPGILSNIIKIVGQHISSDMERHVNIGLDEMKMSPEICFNQKREQIYGPSSEFQVVMLRSIFAKWKYPIFFDYDIPMTKELLFHIIKECEENKIHVHGVSSDYGGTNRKLKNELGISIDKTSFTNPATNENVYFFPCFVHMLKLLRNHMITHGLCLADGTLINKSHYEKLIKSDSNETHIVQKISLKDLNLTDSEKMNVGRAFKMFSNTVYSGFVYLGETIAEFKRIAKFVKLVNDASDIMNSRHPDQKGFKAPFGKDIKKQSELLWEFREEILGLRKGDSLFLENGNKKALLPFQTGMAICISSILAINVNFKVISCYDIKYDYLLTSRFNNDFVENVFSILRGLGRFYLHPSPLECEIRLKSYCMSQLLNPIKNANVLPEEDNEVGLDLLYDLIKVNNENEASQLSIEDVTNSDDIEDTLIVPEECGEDYVEIVNSITKDNYDELLSKMTIIEKTEFGSKEYIAGYIANKLKDKFPELIAIPEDGITATPNIISIRSNNRFDQPSFIWLNQFLKFEEEFIIFHKHSANKLNLDRSPNVISRLVNVIKLKYPLINKDIIHLFVKTRTFARIKPLKRLINESVINRSREMRYVKSSAKELRKLVEHKPEDSSEIIEEMSKVDEINENILEDSEMIDVDVDAKYSPNFSSPGFRINEFFE